MKTRTTGAVAAVLILILAIFSPTAAYAHGKDFGLQGDAAGLVYDFEVSPTRINHNDDFKVSLRFSGGQNEDENREGFIKPGSKIVVPITAGTGAQAVSKLLTPDLSYNGKKIADVDVTSSSISITFTRDVEKLHDVRGFLNVVMTGLNAERGTTRTLKVGNTTVSVAHNRGGDRGVFAGKTGLLYGDSNPGYVTWFLRANINGDSYPGGDVDIADVLGAGQQLDGHGIKIGLHWGGQHRSQYDLRWNSINDFLNDRNYGAYAGTTIDFNQSDGKIAIHIPESVINGKEFSFTYDAKIMDDTQEEFTNTATFDFYENQKKDRIVDTYTVRNPKASGGIEGKTTASLNLDKILKDSRTPVPGVRFKVERQDKGALFPNKTETSKTLITNDKGQIREKGFKPGTLVITEVGAPEGIVFDPQKVIKLEIELKAGDHKTFKDVINQVKKTSVKVTKAWADAEDRDHLRPRSVKIQLLADGKPVEGKVLTLPQNGKWEGSFTDLNAYKPGFTAKDKINYSVKELDVPSGYTPKVTGNQTTGFTVTNTHTPNTVGVEGVKTWDDANNQDGLRPASIQVQLLANGKPHGDPVEVKADEKGAWKYSFVDLPKFAEGKQIVYSVAEVKVPEGYVSKTDGMNLKNTHKPATVSIPVEKSWADSDNQDRKRPDSVVVRLKADGQLVDGKVLKLTKDNAWKSEFSGLPAKKDGRPVVYTVVEDKVDGYISKVENVDGVVKVTNTYTPETVSVEGVKTWDDANNQDGLRPVSIQVQLLANGKPHGDPVEVKADEKGEWKYSFTDLPKFAEGKQIVYSVAEVKVPEGYVSKTDGMNLKNAHKPATVSVEGTKTWDDANNQDGKRPESITIRLLKNGVEADSRTVTAAQKWAWSFTDLPKFDKGQEIVYTITEDAVSGYSAKMAGYNVTNTYTPGKTSVGVAKSWQDGHDQDGLRPESVQVQLLADGKPVEGKVLTLKAANNWAGTFTELEEFKAGKKIAYSVAEVSVPKGYTSQVAGDATRGYTVTNTHTPAVTAIPVLKVWDDADNKDGLRPDSITVRLLANGKPVEGQSLTLTKDNAWKGQFAELPANKGGMPVEYSVVEDKVDGYTSKVESDAGVVKVTNTHTPKADAPALAFTGATVGGLAGAALLSLLTGMAFVLVNRRKKS
ncbi:Cna B-type domain-containing protein [Trueperella pyogenes]|uniref:Cna B-type domain-containing protein n=1 Tax=Trueperella pyogenes TaxID=1661 RepID=UPI00345D8AFA